MHGHDLASVYYSMVQVLSIDDSLINDLNRFLHGKIMHRRAQQINGFVHLPVPCFSKINNNSWNKTSRPVPIACTVSGKTTIGFSGNKKIPFGLAYAQWSNPGLFLSVFYALQTC